MLGALAAPDSGAGEAWSIWSSGEFWMLLAAQSMAVGTVMVPWVSRYVDPVMATGRLVHPFLLTPHYVVFPGFGGFPGFL